MHWTRARRPFVLPMTVIEDDIDEQGIASNLAILAWMLRAAVAHSTSVGYDLAAFRRLGAMFVIRRHEVDYLSSVRRGERLLLRTWPSFMKAATAHRHHEVVRPDGETVARGMNVWAYVDSRTGRPLRMPAEILDAFDPRYFL